MLTQVANIIRGLSVDAIEKATILVTLVCP